MCGIVGYTGPREAGPILIEGLRRLEYRGYDSAGIALVDEQGDLFVEKRAGKLAVLQTAIEDRTPHAAIGLAHTRWATHGRPNDLNAHPHQDCTGDIAVILAHTDQVIFLEEGDVADLRPSGVTITDIAGRPVDRSVTTISWSAEMAEKGGYEHFMLKEIHEQPEALRQSIAGRVGRDDRIRVEELAALVEILRTVNRVELVACGTAYYASLVGAAALQDWTGLPARATIGSEFRYSPPPLGPDTLVIAV